jgi:hypothetical protein
MPQLTIALHSDASAVCCGLCHRPHEFPAGPALCLENGQQPVCRDCGRKAAPSLVALLDLAVVAERVGRVARHTLIPSLETLLHLARAAENYTLVANEKQRQAA